MTAVHITRHAQVRAAQRLKACDVAALAPLALAHGLTWETARQDERRYLLRVAKRPGYADRGREVRLYADTVFIFADDKLVTCWEMPREWRN